MDSCFIPCETDNLCASLEHTWLKNRLLNQVEANREDWAASEEEELPRVLKTIPSQVQRAKDLLTDIYEGYSPAQLVEKVPLSAFPTEIKSIIKKAAHAYFLELGLMQPLAEELETALDQFESATKRLVAEWKNGRDARLRVIDELKSAAVRLRKALLALPREVVLP